jgi:hypothetical protein
MGRCRRNGLSVTKIFGGSIDAFKGVTELTDGKVAAAAQPPAKHASLMIVVEALRHPSASSLAQFRAWPRGLG